MADKEFPATRRQIIERHPLLDYARARGWALRKDGPRYRCICPLHKEDSPSFVIGPDLNCWKCFGCTEAGSVIDLHAKLNNMTVGQAMRDLWPIDEWQHPTTPGPFKYPFSKPPSSDSYDPFEDDECSTKNNDTVTPEKEVSEEIAAYDYQDATGKVVYQVVRFAPKDFRQCKIVDGSKRVWSMESVERLPYRLPELLVQPMSVWVVEGEKDVEVLRAIGQTATCNPGGAGKWLPAFSQYLKNQCVYICPDRDEPGQKHSQGVLKSLEGICKWAKWVELPPEWRGKAIKDVADLREASKDEEEFIDTLFAYQQRARLIEKGIDCDFFSALELESDYIGEKTRFAEVSLVLQNWLPEINVRPLGPGDVLGIVAGTGQLKTAVAQNILVSNPNLPALFFQLELSGSHMFERMTAIATGIDASEVNARYLRGERVNWQSTGKLDRLLVHTANASMKQVDEGIARASAKLGCLPKVFVIDYIQLVRGTGSRYERVSEVCEDAKRIAKKWNVIAILVSQIGRKPEDSSNEVKLYDAKESGSFENSCSVVLGIWKTGPMEMRARVLKNTKGHAGKLLEMKLRGNTFIIEPL